MGARETEARNSGPVLRGCRAGGAGSGSNTSPIPCRSGAQKSSHGGIGCGEPSFPFGQHGRRETR
jgi:hypothetical protein